MLRILSLRTPQESESESGLTRASLRERMRTMTERADSRSHLY